MTTPQTQEEPKEPLPTFSECPNCGGSEWKDRDGEGGTKCRRCGNLYAKGQVVWPRRRTSFTTLG